MDYLTAHLTHLEPSLSIPVASKKQAKIAQSTAEASIAQSMVDAKTTKKIKFDYYKTKD